MSGISCIVLSLLQYPRLEPFMVEVPTYIGLSAALLCFIIAFVVFAFIQGNETNANTIHINLVASLFVANIVFLFGISKTELKVFVYVIDALTVIDYIILVY